MIVLDVAGAVSSGPDRPESVLTVAVDEVVAQLEARLLPARTLSERLRELGRFARAAGRCPSAVSAEDSAAATRGYAAGVSREIVDARIRYDEFFNVRRVAGLAAEEFAHTVLVTVGRTLEHAGDAIVGLPEIIDLLGAIRLMPADAGPGFGARGPAVSTATALDRWITGHHMYALCSSFGHHHLTRALESLDVPDVAAAEMARAEVFVRGASAAMSCAAAMPRSIYLSEIRPLMNAASGSAHGFSGVDNYDYLLMREGWERLHRTLADHPSAMSHPVASAAAIALYEAIVEDNERHTLVAAALVGNAPSLKQVYAVSPAAGAPAVEGLRQNTDQRREMLEILTAHKSMPALVGGAAP